MRDWKIDQTEILYSHRLLDLQRRELTSGDDRREVLVMAAPEWINVIPVLDDGRVVMVRQWRYGIQQPTLEIPGGMVDPGEDARGAALRELEEETGLRAGKLECLGFTYPNPAFITNRLTTWLATDLEGLDEDRSKFGVDGEEIYRELVPLEAIPTMIGRGEISHALVVAAFYLLDNAGEIRPWR
jgi:8-oxo-dGTP pyrophosphatase MutT (NUDIX family)